MDGLVPPSLTVGGFCVFLNISIPLLRTSFQVPQGFSWDVWKIGDGLKRGLQRVVRVLLCLESDVQMTMGFTAFGGVLLPVSPKLPSCHSLLTSFHHFHTFAPPTLPLSCSKPQLHSLRPTNLRKPLTPALQTTSNSIPYVSQTPYSSIEKRSRTPPNTFRLPLSLSSNNIFTIGQGPIHPESTNSHVRRRLFGGFPKRSCRVEIGVPGRRFFHMH